MPLPALRCKPQSRDSGLHRQVNAKLPGFLREMRHQANLSQVELASKIHRTQKHVTDNERGLRRCSISEFLEMADACALDPVAAFAEFVTLTRSGKPITQRKSAVYPTNDLPVWALNETAESGKPAKAAKPARKRAKK